jgi:hypothetical protein
MSARIRLTSSVALLLVLAAACGGTDEQLTRAEFVRQGDAICTEYNEEFAEVGRRYPVTVDPMSPKATDEDLKRFGRSVPRQVEVGRAQVAELRDLQPPGTIEDEWNEVLGDLERGFREFEHAGEAARQLNRDRIAPGLREAVAKFDEANAVSRTLGFRICGAEEGPR